MKNVVSLSVARTQRELTEQDAWQAYLDARARAEASRDITDGIAAGKAWSQWLALFERRSA